MAKLITPRRGPANKKNLDNSIAPVGGSTERSHGGH